MATMPKTKNTANASAMAHATAKTQSSTKPVDDQWLDDIDTIDQESVETLGTQYPWIQWVHGDSRLAKLGGVPHTGGWFMTAEHGFTAEELPDWEPGELTHQEGETTEGFFARDLTIAVIRYRRAWRVTKGGRADLYDWREYDRAVAEAAASGGHVSGRTQILVGVRGLEELGPLVLTMRGSVSKAFMPSRSGDESVLNAFQRCVIAPANTLNRKRGKKAMWPFRAFWLAVGPDRDAKGAPIYTSVGQGSEKSTVTLPVALGLDEKLDPQALGQRYVGSELLAQFSEWWDEADTWAHAWDADALQGLREAAESAVEEEDLEADDPAYVEEQSIPF